jgi:hypothetical protein
VRFAYQLPSTRIGVSADILSKTDQVELGPALHRFAGVRGSHDACEWRGASEDTTFMEQHP